MTTLNQTECQKYSSFVTDKAATLLRPEKQNSE